MIWVQITVVSLIFIPFNENINFQEQNNQYKSEKETKVEVVMMPQIGRHCKPRGQSIVCVISANSKPQKLETRYIVVKQILLN